MNNENNNGPHKDDEHAAAGAEAGQVGSVASQGDDRLIHSLLVHLHDNQVAEHRERRVQRAMQAIRQPAQLARTLRMPSWTRRAGWAAAAMVLIGAGAWLLTYHPATAMASLNDIISSLGSPGDRTYHVTMEDQPAPPRPEGREDDPPERVPRPGLDDATIYLRDGVQYLLKRRDPHGGVIFDGFDGRRSWRIRAGVLEETREGLGAGGIPMPAIMADVPFSDLHQTLERIRTDYTVDRLDQAPVSAGGPQVRHVLAHRNSRQVKGPQTIEIWADPKTAVPKRIVFDHAKLQGHREPCRLTLDLSSEDPLPSNWFQPALHIGRAK
jgi:hypothetical protein